jgi:DNA-binding response OmpR family regulator
LYTPLEPQDATVLVTRADRKKGQLLAGHLRRDGFKVLEAFDAKELIDHCRNLLFNEARLPDVVITDRLQAVEELRAEGDVPPFIVITQSDDWRAFMAAEKLGAAYVFENSPDDSALRNAVFSLTRSW